jgi:CRISPR-associated protein Cmr2
MNSSPPASQPHAFLAFALGPVQPFIAAARTVRDLWTGSYLLAWLTYQAMQPVIARCGREAVVSPDMTRDPMAEGQERSPCLPNRFVAVVPAAEAQELAVQCRKACLDEWRGIAGKVREQLTSSVHARLPGDLAAAWDRSVRDLWDSQVNHFFDLRTAVVRWDQCGPAVLEQFLHPGRRSPTGPAADREWSDRFELLTALQAADKAIRPVPAYQPAPDEEGRFAPKCSLLGTYEQIGPAELGQAAKFWEAFGADNGVALGPHRTRKRERLCAVSLVKRFAGAVLPHTKSPAFDDTATVAAAAWLDEFPALREYAWQKRSSHFLHWSRRNQEEDEGEAAVPRSVWQDVLAARARSRPPTYYAVLMLDGDRMGDKLRGGGAQRHRDISRALSSFALDRVPAIVQEHCGTLIYSGGDDALVLLPTSKALDGALALSDEFRDLWHRQGLPNPDEATVSAGLAIVHYKEDLRFALDTARRAEKAAKDAGRDALVITVCRRSGEHTSALCPWDYVETVSGWVTAFLQHASDRWAYHLAGELPTLEGLEVEAMSAEIKRQVNRAEEPTRKLLGQGNKDEAGAKLVDAFRTYWCAVRDKRGYTAAEALREFITLCQTASFLARGGDQ